MFCGCLEIMFLPYDWIVIDAGDGGRRREGVGGGGVHIFWNI